MWNWICCLFGYCIHSEKYSSTYTHWAAIILPFITLLISTLVLFSSKLLLKRSLQIKNAPTTKPASRRVSCPVVCFHTETPMVVLHAQMGSFPLTLLPSPPPPCICPGFIHQVALQASGHTVKNDISNLANSLDVAAINACLCHSKVWSP